jgi:hypothetical protein
METGSALFFCFELLFCCCLVRAVCRKKEGEEKREKRKRRKEREKEKGENILGNFRNLKISGRKIKDNLQNLSKTYFCKRKEYA